MGCTPSAANDRVAATQVMCEEKIQLATQWDNQYDLYIQADGVINQQVYQETILNMFSQISGFDLLHSQDLELFALQLSLTYSELAFVPYQYPLKHWYKIFSEKQVEINFIEFVEDEIEIMYKRKQNELKIPYQEFKNNFQRYLVQDQSFLLQILKPIIGNSDDVKLNDLIQGFKILDHLVNLLKDEAFVTDQLYLKLENICLNIRVQMDFNEYQNAVVLPNEAILQLTQTQVDLVLSFLRSISLQTTNQKFTIQRQLPQFDFPYCSIFSSLQGYFSSFLRQKFRIFEPVQMPGSFIYINLVTEVNNASSVQ